MATQMQLKVLFNLVPRALPSKTFFEGKALGTRLGFIWKEIAWPPGLLKRKNNNKVVFFSTLFLMFMLTWITEKELGRVIENKRGEFF